MDNQGSFQINRISVGIPTDSKKKGYPEYNLLLNYRKYQRVIGDQKFLNSLNKEERKKLQDFVKNHAIIIPVRVNGKQTSLKIRTAIAALHTFIVGGEEVKDFKQFIMDTVYRITQSWYGEDGKGLSGFVQDTMVRECFDSSEKGHFDYIVSMLNDTCASIGSTRVRNSFSTADGSEIE